MTDLRCHCYVSSSDRLFDNLIKNKSVLNQFLKMGNLVPWGEGGVAYYETPGYQIVFNIKKILKNEMC